MRRYTELSLLILVAAIALALTPSPAAAYLGPGGALPILTAALAMGGAFVVSTVVLVTRQVRTVRGWIRRLRDKKKTDESKADEQRTDDKR